MSDRGSVARQAGLLVAVFFATFALLLGGRTLLGRAAVSTGDGLPSPLASIVTGVASPVPVTPVPGASGAPIVLLGAGDIGDCSLPGAAETADLLIGQPGLVFTAGDNAYEDGTTADYSNCYAPTWGRVLDRTILPAAGNHDWNDAGAAGYLAYFGAKAAPQGVTWYSTDLGSWHVIVLDSNCAYVGGCDDASPEGLWLKKDLRASSAFCTLAIWHQPRFSSGLHGDDLEVSPFWDQLHAARAELVINGHDHDYERFAPQTSAGVVERPGGLREIVAGTGGGELRTFHVQAANSEFREAGVYGVLRLTLYPANYTWEFLPVGSNIADSGSTPCH
jgi:hypothetical protein